MIFVKETLKLNTNDKHMMLYIKSEKRPVSKT